MRRCDSTFRISIQLVDVGTNLDIWSHSHEVSLENEFAVQKRVAAEVALDTEKTFISADRDPSSGEQMKLEYS